MWTMNFQMFSYFRKGRGTRDQIANIYCIIEKGSEFQKNIYFWFIDYAKAFDCVDHNQLWKILKEMGIPNRLTHLLRNLYAGQEATVRTGHWTTDWIQIGKGVRQQAFVIFLPIYLSILMRFLSVLMFLITKNSFSSLLEHLFLISFLGYLVCLRNISERYFGVSFPLSLYFLSIAFPVYLLWPLYFMWEPFLMSDNPCYLL